MSPVLVCGFLPIVVDSWEIAGVSSGHPNATGNLSSCKHGCQVMQPLMIRAIAMGGSPELLHGLWRHPCRTEEMMQPLNIGAIRIDGRVYNCYIDCGCNRCLIVTHPHLRRLCQAVYQCSSDANYTCQKVRSPAKMARFTSDHGLKWPRSPRIVFLNGPVHLGSWFLIGPVRLGRSRPGLAGRRRSRSATPAASSRRSTTGRRPCCR